MSGNILGGWTEAVTLAKGAKPKSPDVFKKFLRVSMANPFAITIPVKLNVNGQNFLPDAEPHVSLRLFCESLEELGQPTDEFDQ